MAYVNLHVSRHLKEELGWAIDKRLQLIINKMLLGQAEQAPHIHKACEFCLSVCMSVYVSIYLSVGPYVHNTTIYKHANLGSTFNC